MRQSRIYTPQQLSTMGNVELTGTAHHYLTRVLRLSDGDAIILFNGDGRDYSGEINGIQRDRLRVNILGHQLAGKESPLKITLVQAICRGERMDYSLQKATELGVHCIQPVISRRVEVRLDEKKQAKRLAHWQRVVVSACEQSGRAVVPDVQRPIMLDEWIADADASPARLVLDATADNNLASLSIVDDDISILVGPEGGFSEREMKIARTNGLIAVSLGPRILRTETAGPAAIAVLQAQKGDL